MKVIRDGKKIELSDEMVDTYLWCEGAPNGLLCFKESMPKGFFELREGDTTDDKRVAALSIQS